MTGTFRIQLLNCLVRVLCGLRSTRLTPLPFLKQGITLCVSESSTCNLVKESEPFSANDYKENMLDSATRLDDQDNNNKVDLLWHHMQTYLLYGII